MAESIDYGKLTKKIIFTDNDHRHAQLLIKLRHDGLSQGDFFRQILTGYIGEDPHIREYVEQVKTQSQKHKQKSKRLRDQGRRDHQQMGFSDGEIEGLFDLIEGDAADL